MGAGQKRDDDDGRVIADMSGIARPGLFRSRPAKDRQSHAAPLPEEDAEKKRPWEADEAFSPEERRMYALGALKAALLIALAFILGLGLVILLLIFVWG